MLLSVAVLYEVTRILGDIWTVKLMLAKTTNMWITGCSKRLNILTTF